MVAFLRTIWITLGRPGSYPWVVLELNPSLQFSQKQLLRKGLIGEAMKPFIITKTLPIRHEDPYETLAGLGRVLCFLSLLEAILPQSGKWEVKARIWNEQDQKILFLKEHWHYDFSRVLQGPVYTWTHPGLSFLVPLADCKHVNAPLVVSRCDLARARHATWAMLSIWQPICPGVHFWRSQLYLGLSPVSDTPSITWGELILENSVTVSERWRK